jgi:hypothetical protein
MHLSEELLEKSKDYIKSYRIMREVEDKTDQLAVLLGQQPPNVPLIFTLPDRVDYIRFNPPACNEVCAVLPLNADHSFPPNEIVIKQLSKNLVIYKINSKNFPKNKFFKEK